jgi:hypothetical protein
MFANPGGGCRYEDFAPDALPCRSCLDDLGTTLRDPSIVLELPRFGAAGDADAGRQGPERARHGHADAVRPEDHRDEPLRHQATELDLGSRRGAGGA